jgi:hypothetical protein
VSNPLKVSTPHRSSKTKSCTSTPKISCKWTDSLKRNLQDPEDQSLKVDLEVDHNRADSEADHNRVDSVADHNRVDSVPDLKMDKEVDSVEIEAEEADLEEEVDDDLYALFL